MSDWVAKRFWEKATAHRAEKGWEIHLDERCLRTPAKAVLTLPTLALAEAIAVEWDSQTEVIDPGSMPLTRMANSAVDKVTLQKPAVVNMLADYGATDLLCYRAENPVELRMRQDKAWDPLLDWARDTFKAPLNATAGVMHVIQPDASLARLKSEVERFDSFELTAFHDLVVLSGSLIIAMAVAHGQAGVASLWSVSQVDETWQEEQWGQDEEATKALEKKYEAFVNAEQFLRLVRTVAKA